MKPALQALLILYIFMLDMITVFSQSIQSKIETAYRIQNSDTTFKHKKIDYFDTSGAILRKDHQFFSSQGQLKKKESFIYNSLKSSSEQSIMSFNETGAIQERNSLHYKKYDKDPAKCLIMNSQFFDNSFELIKEDTMTYEGDLLIKQCSYDYRGNTSLICNEYEYTAAGKLKCWQTFSVWNTIDHRGEVVEKRSRRRLYRYFYNINDDLIRSSGKYYKTRFFQRISRYKNNTPKTDKTLVFRKRLIKTKKESEKQQAKYKSICFREMELKKYGAHGIIEHSRSSAKNEFYKKQYAYKDGQLSSDSIYQNGLLTEKTLYFTENKIKKSILYKYDKTGAVKYRLETFFDALDNPIKEIQIQGDSIISILEYSYDVFNQLILKSLSYQEGNIREETSIEYSYY